MNKIREVIIFIVLVFLCAFSLFFIIEKIRGNDTILKIKSDVKESYIAGVSADIQLYDFDFKKVKEVKRGIKVFYEDYDNEYYSIIYNEKKYLIKKENINDDIVLEEKKYVKIATTIIEDNNILSSINKEQELNIIGYDSIIEGEVIKYRVEVDGVEGFVYSKYLVDSIEETNQKNVVFYDLNSKKEDIYGGGSGALNYPYFEKPIFEDNIMPSEVKAVYINMYQVDNVDEYIKLYSDSGINSVVIDIKDGSVGYPSDIAASYTKSTKYINSMKTYEDAINKFKDNGFYVIGRISVFKDYSYAIDNIENSITEGDDLFSHNSSYWPSPYSRDVWEYNVNLALEAIELFDFNEIQFDYVRFTDGTNSLEEDGEIDLKNYYDETKAEAIEGFLFYAADAIHSKNKYIAVDVFGEAAHDYVTAYGQYWPSISNIVDVISPMPYPDHFNMYQYNVTEIAWVDPYQLLTKWSSYVSARQDETPSPAIVRSWIQAYNAIKSPYVIYGPITVGEEISALYDNDLGNGFIAWNAGSSISKYESLREAFEGEY